MKSRRAMAAVSAALLTSVAGALAGVNTAALSPAAREMVAQFPRSEVTMDQGRLRMIAGSPMSAGPTAQIAVDNFLAIYGEAVAPGLDLRPTWSSTLADGKRQVFAYQQYIANLPVEYGTVRIMTAPGDQGMHRVMFWGGTPAPFGEAALLPALLTGETALAIVKAQKLYAGLEQWSAPEQAVWQGNGRWVTPVRVWKFVGEVVDPNKRRKLTFFVNTQTGVVEHIRNDVIFTDVGGTIQAKGTPGVLPDTATNLPVPMNMPEIRVGIFGELPDYTDRSGVFLLPNSGTSTVSLTTALGPGAGTGKWVWISNTGGGELSITQNATPGSPAALMFNNVPGGANSLTTAQVNAFIHTNKIHNFFRDRSGTWNLIDSSLRANTNLNSTCNAFYDGASINFFKAGGGCVNTAYSDVVAHEYGHHVVNRLGLGQGGFGEGFADSGALLLYDQTILGQGFQGPGTSVRTPLVENIQFPCSGPCAADPHCCGEILAAVWIRIRQNMGTKYGSGIGLTKTQQLMVDWMQIATGGTGDNFGNSANENTAIEVLTINDDDGDLTNGTPDYAPITKAFKAQSVPVPSAPPLGFFFPSGQPGLTAPNTPVTILMNVEELSRVPQANTGKIIYRINNGSWITSNMTQVTTNHYSFTVPAQPCDSIVDYYFQATAAASTNPVLPALVVTFPSTAPAAGAFYYPTAEALNVVLQDNLELASGWVVGAPDDTAITGIWGRDIPQGTAAQPGVDHTPVGTRCYITDYRAGQQVSDYDVDGGKTTLTSPLFDITSLRHPRVNFWLWYSNDVGTFNPNSNTFQIDVSPNNGLSWTTLRALGPAGSETHGKWKFYDLAIDAPVAYTNQMRVRFVASDITGAIVEAAMDDFQVTSLICTTPCYANCDESTSTPVLTVNDFQCFTNRFAAAESYANCDGSTTSPVLNVNDFQCFLNAYAAGCP